MTVIGSATGWSFPGCGSVRPHQAGLRTNIRFIFQAMVTRLHSPRALSSPRIEKLTESEHEFDDAEHRFRRLFAQGIGRPAFRRLQPMRHRLDRRRIVRRGRRLFETLARGGMMRLMAHRNHGLIPAFSQASTLSALK